MSEQQGGHSDDQSNAEHPQEPQQEHWEPPTLDPGLLADETRGARPDLDTQSD